MGAIELAILAISGLRAVMNNPALGGGSSVRLDQASELLGILGTLLQEGDEALDDLKEFTETIESMVEQGRPPSRAEWDILRRRSDDAHARLQAAKEEILGEEPEEPEEPDVPDPDPSPAEETSETTDPEEEDPPPVTG